MAYDKKFLGNLYSTMLRIREFEDQVLEFYKYGKMPGLAHLYIGEEAVATGACATLKKNDFAGIDLPASGKFINFGFLDDCSDHNLPGILPRNVPDPRNTVYWNPSIPAGTDGNTIISFTAPDTPGKYTILLTGFSRTGGLIRTTKTIVISQ